MENGETRNSEIFSRVPLWVRATIFFGLMAGLLYGCSPVRQTPEQTTSQDLQLVLDRTPDLYEYAAIKLNGIGGGTLLARSELQSPGGVCTMKYGMIYSAWHVVSPALDSRGQLSGSMYTQTPSEVDSAIPVYVTPIGYKVIDQETGEPFSDAFAPVLMGYVLFNGQLTAQPLGLEHLVAGDESSVGRDTTYYNIQFPGVTSDRFFAQTMRFDGIGEAVDSTVPGWHQQCFEGYANFGSSGSGLVDEEADLIGVISVITRDAQCEVGVTLNPKNIREIAIAFEHEVTSRAVELFRSTCGQ